MEIRIRTSYSYRTMSISAISPKLQRRVRLASAQNTATSVTLPALQERPRLPPTAKPMTTSNGAEHVLRLMDALRLPVEADVYASLLRDCAASGDSDDLFRVHEHIRLNASRFLRSPSAALVMNRQLLAYVAAGEECRALELFDGMPPMARDSLSWGIVIGGFSKAGDHARALRLFDEMVRERGGVEGGRRVASVVAAAVLRSCGEAGNAELGRCVHGLVVKMGMASCLRSALVRLYYSISTRPVC